MTRASRPSTSRTTVELSRSCASHVFKIVADAFLCSSKSPTHTFFFFTLSNECHRCSRGKRKKQEEREKDIQRCVFYSGRWSRQVTSLDEKSKKGQNGGHSRANPMYTLSVFITDADDKEGKPKWRFSWSPTGAATFAAPCKPWRGWARRKKKTLQGSSAHSLSPVRGGRMTLLARHTVSKRGKK